MLEASTFLWKIIKLKYYLLTTYSDLLSEVHLQSNFYLPENVETNEYTIKIYKRK